MDKVLAKVNYLLECSVIASSVGLRGSLSPIRDSWSLVLTVQIPISVAFYCACTEMSIKLCLLVSRLSLAGLSKLFQIPPISHFQGF